MGRKEAAKSTVAGLIAKSADKYAYQIAATYAWRGEPDRAFEWLERAYAQHDGDLLDLKTGFLVRKLRLDPRYRALLKKMNLPAD